MTKKRSTRRRRAEELFEQERTVVVVCRGGDCGSRRKHPETDHLDQLHTIRRDLAGSAIVATSKCLDACEHSNVVVVIPAKHARQIDPTPVWIEAVNDPEVTGDLVEWVTAGGPVAAPEPVSIETATFTPTRLSRHELSGGAVALPQQ